MAPNPARSSGRLANGCACGHLPSWHMQVTPLEPGTTGGSYALRPTGPCSLCGASACPRYSPVP